MEALLSLLGNEKVAAQERVRTALDSDRIAQLMDGLYSHAVSPPFQGRNEGELGNAGSVASASFVVRPWRQLTREVEQLSEVPTDHALHRVRILAKRCRYAAEAVSLAAGEPARSFAAKLAKLQTVLGDHQDAVVAEAWLRRAAPNETRVAMAAGELIMLQRAQRARARAEWMSAWRSVSDQATFSWIPRTSEIHSQGDGRDN